MNKPPNMSQAQVNAFIEQQIINGRILAMKQAQKLAALRAGRQQDTPVSRLIEDAVSIEAYIMKDLDALKKKSSLVLQANMPPPGEFKPGD